MANVVKGFLDFFRLNDEDEDEDEFDDFDIKEEERALKRTSREQRKNEGRDDNMQDTVDMSTYNRKGKGSKNDKVVPIRATAKGFEVSIMKPTSFEDSQDICDLLMSGRVAVINLEGFDIDLAQRIMDFVSGCVYAVNGKLHQISNYIFIVTPDNVDISGDYLDLLESNGFEVPTLNKEF